MALINCPDCSTEVSDTAFKCPKCGVKLRTPVRSVGGKIIKWGFIVFNGLMALWVFGGLQATSEMTSSSDAEAVGQAIGAGLGMAMIGTVWFVGFVILGGLVLITRPKAD